MPKTLKELKDELLLQIHELDMKQRTRKPDKWQCEVCGKLDDDPEVIIEHLRKAHRFPQEDAGLSTRPVHYATKDD